VEILVSSRSKGEEMMYLNLTRQNLDKIIESLKKNYIQSSDRYLIEYLETVRKNYPAAEQISLDEIPF
jgi:hypothetical protein